MSLYTVYRYKYDKYKTTWGMLFVVLGEEIAIEKGKRVPYWVVVQFMNAHHTTSIKPEVARHVKFARQEWFAGVAEITDQTLTEEQVREMFRWVWGVNMRTSDYTVSSHVQAQWDNDDYDRERSRDMTRCAIMQSISVVPRWIEKVMGAKK